MMHGPQTPSASSPFSHTPFFYQEYTPSHSELLKTIPRQHLPQYDYYKSIDSDSFNNINTSYIPYPFTNLASVPLSRPLPPHIALQRASEPGSPATIATTISSHSTPSPSPGRVAIMSDPVSTNTDFALFEDSLIAATQASQDLSQKGRDIPRNMSNEGTQPENSSIYDQNTSTHYSSGPFPIIVPNDGTYSNNYNPGNIYNNYPSLATDSVTPLYTATPSQRLLQPPYDYGNSSTRVHTQSPAVSVDSRHLDEEDVPALSPAPSRNRYSRSSRPSVSSIDTYRSAATPDRSCDEGDDKSSYSFTPPIHIHTPVPKLGRTYSDAVQDELYNPTLIRPSEYVPKKQSMNKKLGHHKSSSSTSSNLKNMMASFPDLFQEAQQQHQHDLAKVSPRTQEVFRDRSPFRANSPFHPVNSRFPLSTNVYNSARQPVIKQEQLESTSQDLFQKQPEQANPKTISPRDALLEYTEPEGEGVQMNLFAPLRENSSQEDATNNNNVALHPSSQGSELDDFQSMATSRRASLAASSASSHNTDYSQYHFNQPVYANDTPTYYNNSSDASNTQSYEDNRSNYSDESVNYKHIEKPADTKANSGTYTCTYTGCGQRFVTSAKLQKHRRESHRKSPSTSMSVSTTAAIAARNAQPGPHRCMRPNANGKPCNSVFSRPYDLTRHEDTIHNARKEKVRCEICNDEKTFSRPDALVRHRRVKHGIH